MVYLTWEREMPSKQKKTDDTLIKPKIILLVEDDPVVLRTTARVLSRLDYEVLPHQRAGEALASAILYADKIALLVTDMMMPEMNGDRLAQKIHQHLPELPVLYMSGYSHDIFNDYDVDRETAFFVGKPFTPQELIDKVIAALEKH